MNLLSQHYPSISHQLIKIWMKRNKGVKANYNFETNHWNIILYQTTTKKIIDENLSRKIELTRPTFNTNKYWENLIDNGFQVSSTILISERKYQYFSLMYWLLYYLIVNPWAKSISKQLSVIWLMHALHYI